MATWKADTVVLRNKSGDFTSITGELTRISRDIKNVGNLSGLSFSGKSVMQARINELSNAVVGRAANTRKMGEQLSTIAMLYEHTERIIVGNTKESVGSQIQKFYPNNKVEESSGRKGVDESVLEKEYQEKSDSSWDPTEEILKFLGKLFPRGSKSLILKLLLYLKDYVDFWAGGKMGWSGLSDSCDLGKTSTVLWKEIYKYLTKKLPAEDAAAFMGQYGSAVAEISILGSVLGFLGGVYDFFNSTSTTPNSIIADYIDAMGGAANVVKDVYEFKDIVNPLNAQKKWLTSAGKYAILAETITSVISQTFRSIDKYSADGEWTFNDLLETGVDTSVAGLETLISGVTFGLISKETIGMSVEVMSEGLKDSAKDLGTSLGNYINQNPELQQKYRSGSIFDQIGILMEAGFNLAFA